MEKWDDDVRNANEMRTTLARERLKNESKMKAELICPIEKLRGMLRRDGYYFRMYKGEQIVQRCPSKWKDTPARKAAREKFAKTWGKRYKKT